MLDGLTLGRKLYALREDRKYSQSRLEIEADLSFGTISRIENGIINPTKETLYRINSALKLNDKEFNYLISSKNSLPTLLEVDFISPYINDILNKSTFPSFVTDHAGRVWFWNQACLKIFGIDSKIADTNRGINFLRLLFDPRYGISVRIPKSSWRKFIADQVISYKKMSYVYRKEEFCSKEIRELSNLREFKTNWDKKKKVEEYPITNTMKLRYQKQVLNIEIITTPLYNDNRFLLIKYYPKDSTTSNVFEQLRKTDP